MGDVRITSTPYDDVFRTLLNDCSHLIIPVINEIFSEKYSGAEKIIFSPSEHFLNQQDGNEEERITDSSFTIMGKEAKKYHLECQSNSDNSMLVRFFEYDTQIALDEGVLEHIAKKYENIRRGVKSIMGGKVLDYEAKTIRNEGLAEGMERGIERGMERGMEKGILGTVSILKNLGIPAQTILIKIQEQYGLTPEDSRKYL